MRRPQVVGQPDSGRYFYQGINQMADLLAPTLGPTGGIVAHHQTSTSGKIELLDDSSTIARRILSLDDGGKDVGAMVMRSLIWRVGQRAGDGGATAAVLARAIFNESQRFIAAGVNAIQLSRGIEKGMKETLKLLREQSRPVTDENALASVARTITSEDKLSAVLGEMSFLLGPDAHVIIEKYVAPYLYRRYIAGAHFKAEILSMYFYTQAEQRKAIHNTPAIAIIDDRVKEAADLLPLLEAALQKGAKSLVVLATDISGSALNLLVANQQQEEEKKKISLLAVKLRDVGDERRWALNDLATMTGATVLGPNFNCSAKDATVNDLGQAQRVEFANKGLVVVADPAKRGDIQDEVTRLRDHIVSLRLDDEERPKLVKRLGTMSGGVGELKIGAITKLEREVLHNQAERAFKVLSSAQRGGVLAGGGAALQHCVPELRTYMENGGNGTGPLIGDEKFGVQALANSLSAPLVQILGNSGEDAPAVFVQRIQNAGSPATYDALKGEVVDAYSGGVLDVTDVVATALQTAASGAMMALSTDAIIYHRKPEQSLSPG